MYLHSLPTNKKNVPELVQDPIALIRDVRNLVEKHRHDSHEKATTGRPVLKLPHRDHSKHVSVSIILLQFYHFDKNWIAMLNVHSFSYL